MYGQVLAMLTDGFNHILSRRRFFFFFSFFPPPLGTESLNRGETKFNKSRVKRWVRHACQFLWFKENREVWGGGLGGGINREVRKKVGIFVTMSVGE